MFGTNAPQLGKSEKNTRITHNIYRILYAPLLSLTREYLRKIIKYYRRIKISENGELIKQHQLEYNMEQNTRQRAIYITHTTHEIAVRKSGKFIPVICRTPVSGEQVPDE